MNRFASGTIIGVLLSVISTAGSLAAAESAGAGSGGKLSGKAYFEYYHPSDMEEDYSEFQFTRFYFTYDYKVSDDISIRYRLDGDRSINDHKWHPFLKHAFVSMGGMLPHTKILAGMQGTPNWSFYSEPFWGYRSVEKTIQDRHHVGTSADAGIGLDSAPFGDFRLHLLVANGTGYGGPENDKYKKIYAALAYKPEKMLTGSIFFDYEPTSENYSNTTITLFGGVDLGMFSAGGEFFTRTNQDSVDVEKTGLSVFGNVDVKVGKVFGRFDSYDPGDDGDHGEKETLILVGFDYKVDKKLHIMPNVISIKEGDHDVVNAFRLTFEFKF